MSSTCAPGTSKVANAGRRASYRDDRFAVAPLAALGRGCVKTPLHCIFGGLLTPRTITIVEYRAI